MPFNPELGWSLFKNDKGGNPKRPDYRGKCQVGGVEYELAGWIRTRKSDGVKFISGSMKVKAPKPAPTSNEQADPDDAPFRPVTST